MDEESMTFPVLKVQSLVTCLEELGIPVKPNDIKEPSVSMGRQGWPCLSSPKPSPT
jgi:hypothetical protein